MKFLKEKILTKKTIYVLCFCLLTVIEVLTNSMLEGIEVSTGYKSIWEVLPGWYPGDILVVARNCTGFVMMILIFSHYKFRELFSIPNIVWTVFCFVIVKFIPDINLWAQDDFNSYQVQTVVLNVWWIFIAIKKLVYDYLFYKKAKFKLSATSVVWILMTFFMAISVNENNIWPVWYLVMFGIFYLTTYSEKERKALWDGMIDGCVFGCLCMFGLACLSRPYDELRYRGLHGNSNIAGVYYLVIYMMLLCKLHVLDFEKAKKWKKAICLLLAGAVLSLQFFTMCRTAWIVSVVLTLVYGVLVVRKVCNKKWTFVLLRWSAIVLSMAIMFIPTFQAVRWGPTLNVVRVWQPGEKECERFVQFAENANSLTYTEFNEMMEEAIGRVANILITARANNPFVMRTYAMEENVMEIVELDYLNDSTLKIRISIYKTYLERLRWLGYKNSEGHFDIANSVEEVWNAQNVWIQMLYFYGVFSGVLFIVLTIMLFVKNYKKIVADKKNPYVVITFLLCIVFFGFGSMEVVWGLGQLSLFLIFFTNMPINSIYERQSGEECGK